MKIIIQGNKLECVMCTVCVHFEKENTYQRRLPTVTVSIVYKLSVFKVSNFCRVHSHLIVYVLNTLSFICNVIYYFNPQVIYNLHFFNYYLILIIWFLIKNMFHKQQHFI